MEMSRAELFRTVLKGRKAQEIVMMLMFGRVDYGSALSLLTDHELFKAVKACQKNGLI
ncbi:hypothetical protein LCGC14_0236020 [marine sediment metagenome]|uniref:Uncharacterized protein n=1 Tax=marine sediment metagenome TaxID=412755 RepID=A0A0F9WTV4_9ZZZZ